MSAKIRLSQRTLLKIWGIATLSAIIVFVILQMMDAALLSTTTVGLLHLDKASTAAEIRFMLDRWQSPMDAGLAGAILGLSCLLAPLYGAALYLGGLTARDAFATRPGRGRRYMNALTMAPVIAALCDLLSRAMQIQMLVQGPDVVTATATYELIILKWAGVLIGILMTLIGLVATLVRHIRKKREDSI